MTLQEFLDHIQDKAPPAPAGLLLRFELELGVELPAEYREFLVACNGGYVGGALWFLGPTPFGDDADAGIHHVGGFREESFYSLIAARDAYQVLERRIPRDLIWMMDDPFGNAICLGVCGDHRGRVFFWDHELEPPPGRWDGRLETAGNIQLLSASFLSFVAGLQVNKP